MTVERLRQAIDTNDLATVQALLTQDPALHQAPLGYANNGPLTWVAECRVPWERPSPTRLAMAAWMIDHGSDVHQGGDGPLFRAALRGERIPMLELLVERGADVNARWNGRFPILCAPCESVDLEAIGWLLDHGADPNCAAPTATGSGAALDYLLGTYIRSPRLGECIDRLLAAGATTACDPAALDVIRGHVAAVAARLRADPDLVFRRYPGLNIGATAGRRLTLEGATLLHVAAEFGQVEIARHLLDHGADPNALALVNTTGIGGQTPLFHAASQVADAGLEVARLLLTRGADPNMVATVPGHYERPEEDISGTPFDYAQLFPGDDSNAATLQLFRSPGPAGQYDSDRAY